MVAATTAGPAKSSCDTRDGWPDYGKSVDEGEMLEFCLTLPGAWMDNPFHPDHPVVKVGPGEHGKIFAFLNESGVGVKAGVTREVADEWLDRHPEAASVMAYIGRSGWNELAFGSTIEDDELREAVEESYRLVVARMPRKHRPAG